MKRGEFLLSLIAAPFAAKVLSNTTEAPSSESSWVGGRSGFEDIAVRGSGDTQIWEAQYRNQPPRLSSIVTLRFRPRPGGGYEIL